MNGNRDVGGPAGTHRRTGARWVVAVIAGVALAVDLATKAWVRASLPSPEGLDPAPFLALRPMFNEGTTFGFLSVRTESGLLLLTVVTPVIVLGLAWWAARARELQIAIGAALVAAGALGNLIDRQLVGW